MRVGVLVKVGVGWVGVIVGVAVGVRKMVAVGLGLGVAVAGSRAWMSANEHPDKRRLRINIKPAIFMGHLSRNPASRPALLYYKTGDPIKCKSLESWEAEFACHAFCMKDSSTEGSLENLSFDGLVSIDKDGKPPRLNGGSAPFRNASR